MRMLTHDPRALEVLNLGSAPGGHGPFVVRQEGCAPGREGAGEDRFFLRDDGTWVLNLTVCALPPAEQRRFFFPSLAGVTELLERLPSEVRAEPDLPPGMDRAAVLAAFHRPDNLLWRRMTGTPGSSPAPPPGP